MGKTCSAEKGHSPTRGTPSKPTFPTFPYEQNDKTLARLERLAASPFFDGRVRPPSRANYISRKVVGKSTRDNPERYQGSFESTLLQRNLKQWYQRYPANSRRIFGRRFSPSEGEEGEKRRPEIRFSQAIREAMDVCLRVLKESNKSRFDSYSVRKSVLIICHIAFHDCRKHIFSDNFSRNSC